MVKPHLEGCRPLEPGLGLFDDPLKQWDFWHFLEILRNLREFCA